MRNGLGGLSTYGFKGLRKGDKHSAFASVGHGTFIFTYLMLRMRTRRTVPSG